jgi:hypothetical protein
MWNIQIKPGGGGGWAAAKLFDRPRVKGHQGPPLFSSGRPNVILNVNSSVYIL